jgi:hypothetical protein
MLCPGCIPASVANCQRALPAKQQFIELSGVLNRDAIGFLVF